MVPRQGEYMKSHLFLATAITAIVAVPSMAFADDDAGWYLRGNIGYGIHSDDAFVGDINGAVQSEGNVTASVGVGYEFGNNWRLELDGANLFTDLGELGNFPGSTSKLRTTSVMLNALYDFQDFGNWEPYVGAGLGLARGKAKVAAHTANLTPIPGCAGGIACGIQDSDTSLAWQVLAGLGYKITDNLTWDTHYRYLDAGEFNFLGHSTAADFSSGPAAANFDTAAHSLLTGFRYRFGGSKATPPPPPPPVVRQERIAQYTCPDGSIVPTADTQCTVVTGERVAQYTCWDGSIVPSADSVCPPQTVQVQQPVVVQQVVSSYNNCGASNVAIFNVPAGSTPKQLTRLGTLPEFGDSHELSATQFFEKLQGRYASDAADRAYLNYLFKSMGYTNGFKDAQAYMFSEETLPVGTSGVLGLGKSHHYAYSVLPSNTKDREAFRIQSANGTVVHFMKTCGNYFYPCN